MGGYSEIFRESVKQDNMKLNLNKIDSIEVEGIDTRDYPDFCDAFISYAEIDGRELTDEELDYINNNCPDMVYDAVLNQLY